MRSREFHIDDKTKIATGLNSKSTYDWPSTVEQLTTTEHAAVAIVMFGANDRPPVRIKGVVDPGLSESFSKTYSGRVAGIVKSLRKAKMQVVWLGHPVVKDPDYNDDMAFLNQTMQAAAEPEGAKWVPLWDITGGDPGTFSATGKALDGQTRRLRADDGVHFTSIGYDLVAARLDPILKELTMPAPSDVSDAAQTQSPPQIVAKPAAATGATISR